MGGQLILLKSVLSSLLVYFLSFFKAPSGIIASLDSIFSKFFGEGVRLLGKYLGLNEILCGWKGIMWRFGG